MSSLRRCRLGGFTLIELLIVILIIGILVAIAVPAYLRYTASANDRDAQAALQTAYKAAVAGDTEVNSSRFPIASTVVNDVKADEPAANVVAGDCISGVGTAPVKQVLVDPSSTSTQITMCVKSASGAIWKLTGPLTGAPTISDASVVALTVTGTLVTDASRASAIDGDGLKNDSSIGIWEGTTNLAKNGGFESGLSYTGNYGAGSVIGDNAHVLFGLKSEKFTGDGTSPSAGIYATDPASGIPNNRLAATPGTNYTESAYVWTSSAMQFRPVIEWYQADGSTRSTVTATSYGSVQTSVPGTWTRLVASGVAPPDAAGMTPAMYMSAGPTSATWWYDGFQVEAKAVATPYVETNGAQATRAAAQVQAPATLVNPTKSWVAARVRIGRNSTTGSPGNGLFFLHDSAGGGQNGVLCYWSASGSGGWTLYSRIAGATQDQASMNSPSNAVGTVETVICAWDSSTYYVSVNGAAFATAPRAHGIPAGTMTDLELGSLLPWLSASQFDGDILWLATGTGALTNADAATISSWGSNDPKRSSFPAAAQATMIWDGTTSAGSLK